MKEKIIILKDSPESCSYKTDLKGWVSANGFYYGEDKNLASYAGCTHYKCEKCEYIYPKNSYCRPCRDKKSLERFLAYPVMEWDKVTPLCLYNDDKYFFEFDSVRDFASDVGCEVEDLQLMICEPNYAREVGYNEMYDELPEDMGLHDVATELAAMFDEINKYIAEHKPIISWGEGKCRAKITNS